MKTNRVELSMNELEQVSGAECDPFDTAKKAADLIGDLPDKAVEVVEKVWDFFFG